MDTLSRAAMVADQFSDGLRVDIADNNNHYVEVALSQRSVESWEEPCVDLEIVANMEALSVIEDEKQVQGIVRITLGRRQISALTDLLKNHATEVERRAELSHQRRIASMRES